MEIALRSCCGLCSVRCSNVRVVAVLHLVMMTLSLRQKSFLQVHLRLIILFKVSWKSLRARHPRGPCPLLTATTRLPITRVTMWKYNEPEEEVLVLL